MIALKKILKTRNVLILAKIVISLIVSSGKVNGRQHSARDKARHTSTLFTSERAELPLYRPDMSPEVKPE